MAKAAGKTKPEKHKKPEQDDSASPLLDYLRLLRIPNVFTAMADVAMGFLFVYPVRSEPVTTLGDFSRLLERGVFPLLLLASCLLYLAGMVLNDVYDVELDRKQRPERPLPSGRIPLATAARLGYGMLLGGVLLGWLAGVLVPWSETLPWRSGLIATLLAGCVVAYDARLKSTSLGPLAMGACRFLNVLLGMSAGAFGSDATWLTLGFSIPQLLAAAGIGIYIAGVTLFARTEARESDRLQLGMGLAVMVAGIVLLGLFPHYLPAIELARWRADNGQMLNLIWPMLLAVLSITIVRRCSVAVVSPSPEHVQSSVKSAIVSIVVLDAAVCFLMSGPYAALGVLLLLVPMLLLGRWVYST